MRLLDKLVRRYGNTFWEGQASGAAVLTTTYGSPDREAVLPQMTVWALNANAADAVVFAAIAIRMMMLAEAKFQFQRASDNGLFGDTRLGPLEHPWPGGTSGELWARMEQDTSLTGNAYIWAVPGEDRLVRLRPDWVTIVSEIVKIPGGGQYRNKVGYWWEPPKSVLDQGKGEFYPAEEVAHWTPLPDPQADFRGMSWLTPVYQDVNADMGLTAHKIKYLQNAATPNMVIRYPISMQPGTIDALRERMQARYGGVDNAFKTLVLDKGADLTVVGDSLEKMDFTAVGQAGADRILAAAGVPGRVVGLDAMTTGAGNLYGEVIRRFADMTLRPLWRSGCSALEAIIPGLPNPGTRLYVDTGEIVALQDGEQVRAQVALVRAQAILTLTQAGASFDSAVAAVEAGDVTQLEEAPLPAAVPAQAVQHLLPQSQPGATADPLPPNLPRLPVGSTSPGDGGNLTRPTPRPAAARRTDDLDADGSQSVISDLETENARLRDTIDALLAERRRPETAAPPDEIVRANGRH